ncbi:MAG: N-acetylneuraminate synthase family protein [Blautia sp.]|nr:N-acetylneuraminate synthase family protein [Blautia sp.]MCM1200787.1 N-acetylneuraminate synthase family protein [Bacteroides fragilis]
MANQEIKLGNYVINENSFPYIIAEIGINHNGDLQVAKKLIDAAHACSWNCVKFQKREPEISVPEGQKNVMRDTPWGRISYLEYKKKIEFGKKEYDYIDTYCKDKPIAWTASPWDIPSLEFLMNYDLPFIKIASASNANKELLRLACESKKPLLVSTGMSSIEETDKTVDFLEKHSDGNYILLHTNSAYPAPAEELNLRTIKTLRERYHCLVGYSGHEMDLEPTVVAASLGAKVLERHVTLDHNMWGTDQEASLSPVAMAMLPGRLKEILIILGNGEKRITEREKEVREKLRGS